MIYIQIFRKIGSSIFTKPAVKRTSGGTIHISSLMTIVSVIKIILRLISK
jgi:hypothetical protein